MPDLFREGQGVVAEGVLAAGGRLSAEAILAKHDERYMPREVVEALKKQGRWQEGAKPSDRRRSAISPSCSRSPLSLAQASVAALGRAASAIATLMAVGTSAALGQFACVALAFAALAYAHLASDFSVLNVAENSHSAAPAIYKFSGVWGNHEGSMLLWVLILAVFGAMVAVFGRSLPRPAARRRARRAGADQRRLPRFHPADLEPVRAPVAGPVRGPATSTRSSRTRASRSIRRCSISAMSASRSSFPSPPRR